MERSSVSRRTKNIETAFEVTVNVPRYLVDETRKALLEFIEEMAGYDINRDEPGLHEKMEGYIVKGMTEEIQQGALETDASNWLDYNDVMKFFKAEIKKWQDLAEAKAKAEEEALKAEQQRIENELKKNGRLLSIPDKQTYRAMQILKAAGITVKALAP